MLENSRIHHTKMQMLADLDILASSISNESTSDRQILFEKVSTEIKSGLVQDQNGNRFQLGCNLSNFKRFGPGIYLMFRLIKYLLIVMSALLPLVITNLILAILEHQSCNNKNLQTSLECTTIAGVHNYRTLYQIINFTIVFIFICSLFNWKYLETGYVLECSNQVCLSSYFTVILNKIPNYYNQKQMKAYLDDNFGVVHSIYTIKNYKNDLIFFKQINQIIDKIKIKKSNYLRFKNSYSCLALLECFIQFQKMYQKIQVSKMSSFYESNGAFITFKSILSRQKLIAAQKDKKKFCFSNQNQQKIMDIIYKGQSLSFKRCQMEPDGIIWENLNIQKRQKTLRYAIILSLLVLFLVFALFIIFIVIAINSSLYNSQYFNKSGEQIMTLNSSEATKQYCMELSLIKFKNQDICSAYQNSYALLSCFFIFFPLLITFLKFLFVQIMKKLVKVRRHKYQFHRIEWEIIIVSIFYFIKTGLIKLIIYRKFHIGNLIIVPLDLFLPILQHIKSVLPIHPSDIQIYQSFNNEWVEHSSHNVLLISLFSFNISIFIEFILSFIKKKYFDYQAKKEQTYQRIKQYLQGQELQFQYIYAQTIAIMLFNFLYFPCMPLVFILSFFSLFCLYWVIKNKFIKFCQIPPVYSHSISNLTVKIMMIGLLLNTLITPNYFGSLQDQDENLSYFDKIKSYWYYLLLTALSLSYFWFWSRIVQACNFLYQKLKKCKNSQYKQRSFENKLTFISNNIKLQSYSMHDNEKYQKILRTLFILNKAERNQFWYYHHEQIEELKNKISKYSNKYALFYQINSYLQYQYNKFKINEQNKLKQNPFQKYVNLFSDIKMELNNQQIEQNIHQNLQSLIKSQIRNTDVIENILKQRSRIKGISQSPLKKNQEAQIDYPLETESRFRGNNHQFD